MKNIEESRNAFSKFYESKAIALTSGLEGSLPTSRTGFINRKSFRNILLFTIYNPSSAVLNVVLHNIQREDLILGFMNINDLFAALIDNGNIPNSIEENWGFINWIDKKFSPSQWVGVLNSGDVYEGDIACISAAGGLVHIKMEILEILQHGKDDLFHVLVRMTSVSLEGMSTSTVSANFYPRWGMLYIPSQPDSRHGYPMTLFMFRSNSFSVEYFGTVERIGCGAVSLSGTLLTQSTRGSLESVPQNDKFNVLDFAFNRFNNVIMKYRDLKEPKRIFSISAHMPPGKTNAPSRSANTQSNPTGSAPSHQPGTVPPIRPTGPHSPYSP
jgi:hypothetical protein